MESLIIMIFTVDYMLRLLTVHASRHFHFNHFDVMTYFLTFEVISETQKIGERVKGAKTALTTPGYQKTLSHVLTPMDLIDLISILPFYLQQLLASGGSSLTVIRILRLCRLFRLFKLKKYSAGFEVFLQTLVQVCALTMHPLCTHYAPTMYSLYTHYTPTMHPLCTHYALTVHPLCTPVNGSHHSAPLHPGVAPRLPRLPYTHHTTRITLHCIHTLYHSRYSQLHPYTTLSLHASLPQVRTSVPRGAASP
jgi:hypothetical protein